MRKLLAETETLYELVIPLGVFLLEVLQKPPTPSDEHQQPAPRVVVLRVRLEVVRQVRDAVGEQRDLDFWRAGILLVGLVITDDLRLVLPVRRDAQKVLRTIAKVFSTFIKPMTLTKKPLVRQHDFRLDHGDFSRADRRHLAQSKQLVVAADDR